MVEPVAELNKARSIQTPDILEKTRAQLVLSPKTTLEISKQDIRSTLKASTLDGVFASVFESATSGVILSNFLLQLGATNVAIGILSAIPMVVNLLQPLGAYIADRTTSRHWYNLWVFGASRLLWLVLVVKIVWGREHTDSQQLIQWTLATALAASVLAALANPNWFSWMAAVVPHRLRGRYFGFRNSAVSLITLLGVPLMGLGVSNWGTDPIFGYGIVLCLGVLAGLISLGFQFLMVDVNPQVYGKEEDGEKFTEKPGQSKTDFLPAILKDANFLIFLGYLILWTFAVNLSAPFFNIYLLKDLNLDVSLVTIYNSLSAGANLLLLLFWGLILEDVWKIRCSNQNKHLINLFDDVDRYNGIIKTIQINDQIEEAGNSQVKIADRTKVIQALQLIRDDLVRALKTERILRENKKFVATNSELFSNNLTALSGLQISDRASEQGRLLNEALQVALGVQAEMKKLQNRDSANLKNGKN